MKGPSNNMNVNLFFFKLTCQKIQMIKRALTKPQTLVTNRTLMAKTTITTISLKSITNMQGRIIMTNKNLLGMPTTIGQITTVGREGHLVDLRLNKTEIHFNC